MPSRIFMLFDLSLYRKLQRPIPRDLAHVLVHSAIWNPRTFYRISHVVADQKGAIEDLLLCAFPAQNVWQSLILFLCEPLLLCRCQRDGSQCHHVCWCLHDRRIAVDVGVWEVGGQTIAR